MNILDLVTIPGATVAYAEEAATTQVVAEGPQGEVSPVMSGIVTFLPMIFVIVLLYFMMIRPQKKREKEMKDMINALKVGDKVVTIGGICGKVTKIKDEFVILETGNVGTPTEKSYIKMERDSIKSVEKKETV